MGYDTPNCEACGGVTYEADEAHIYYRCQDCGHAAGKTLR